MTDSSVSEVIVEPFVLTSILDHVKRMKVMTDESQSAVRARGWLTGIVRHNSIVVTHFMPDTYNIPENKVGTLEVEYGIFLKDYNAALKAYHPHDSKIVGFYAAGDGQDVVTRAKNHKGEDIEIATPYAQWATVFRTNKHFKKQSVQLLVKLPSAVHGKTLSVEAILHEHTGTKGSAPVKSLKFESAHRSDNVIMQSVIREAYGEALETSVVPTLNLDLLIANKTHEEAESTITGAVESLQQAVALAKSALDKNSSKASASQKEIVALAAALEAEKKNVAEGSMSDTRIKNALMVKYIATLIQQRLAQLELNMKMGRMNGFTQEEN